MPSAAVAAGRHPAAPIVPRQSDLLRAGELREPDDRRVEHPDLPEAGFVRYGSRLDESRPASLTLCACRRERISTVAPASPDESVAAGQARAWGRGTEAHRSTRHRPCPASLDRGASVSMPRAEPRAARRVIRTDPHHHSVGPQIDGKKLRRSPSVGRRACGQPSHQPGRDERKLACVTWLAACDERRSEPRRRRMVERGRADLHGGRTGVNLRASRPRRSYRRDLGLRPKRPRWHRRWRCRAHQSSSGPGPAVRGSPRRCPGRRS